jgi:hypothetical protein
MLGFAVLGGTTIEPMSCPGRCGGVCAMFAIHPFDGMGVLPIGEAESLLSPDDTRFQTLVYQATDAAVVQDLLTDPQLVPKGLVRDDGGTLRAIFWQWRPGR